MYVTLTKMALDKDKEVSNNIMTCRQDFGIDS